MSDLIESRISEIRTDYALAHDLLDTAAWISSIAPETTHVMRVVQAVMYLQGKAESRPSPESVEHLIRVDPWACAIAALVRQHDRSDLEALLAERERIRSNREAWKNFAYHVAHCVECGEMNYETCFEGNQLHDAAVAGDEPSAAVDIREHIVGRLSAPLDPSSAPRCQQRWGDGCGGMMLCGYGDAHECGLASLHEGPCVCIACAGSETPFVAEYELATISNFENLLDDSAFKTDFVQVKLDEIDTIVSLVNRLRARSPEADEAGVAQDG